MLTENELRILAQDSHSQSDDESREKQVKLDQLVERAQQSNTPPKFVIASIRISMDVMGAGLNSQLSGQGKPFNLAEWRTIPIKRLTGLELPYSQAVYMTLYGRSMSAAKLWQENEIGMIKNVALGEYSQLLIAEDKKRIPLPLSTKSPRFLRWIADLASGIDPQKLQEMMEDHFSDPAALERVNHFAKLD